MSVSDDHKWVRGPSSRSGGVGAQPLAPAPRRPPVASSLALGFFACLGLTCAERPAGDAAQTSGAAARAPLAEDEDARPAPGVAFAGCAAVVAGPVCELPGAGALRVWTPSEARATFTFDREPVAAEGRPVDGGVLYTLALPPASAERAGHLHLRLGEGAQAGAWSLATRPVDADPRLARADQLKREGALDRAKETLGDPSEYPASSRGRVMAALGRVALAQGRTDVALTWLERSMADHAARGRVSDRVRDAAASAWALIELQRRYREAADVLDAVAAHQAEWPEARFHVPYNRALLAKRTGDLRAALALTRQAERAAARLGEGRLSHIAHESAADILLALGRGAEAVEAFEALAHRELDACDRARLDTNIAWALLSSTRPEAPEPAREATQRLERALDSLRAGCPQPADIANVRLNLALAALMRGEVAAAEAQLAEVRAGEWTARGERLAWLLDLEGRLRLAQGEAAEALQIHNEQLARAEAAMVPEAIWRAQLRRGEALEALEQWAEAEAAYRDAEGVIDEHALLVPLDAGRASFLSERDRSARRLVDLLVRRGRAADALGAARIARARALASVRQLDRLDGLEAPERARWDAAVARYREERLELDALAADDWKLSGARLEAARQARRERLLALRHTLDEAFALLGAQRLSPAQLSPPAEGELILALFPLASGEGWHAFARVADGVVVEQVSLAGEAVLAPFAESLRAAERLRVLAYGEAQALDVHALPFDGAPLIATLPVVYGVDLPLATGQDEGRAASRRALVVSDPRHDLPWAAAEGRAVVAALEGWQTRALAGDAASGQAVAEALGEVELMHYAGHGTFAGATGFESRLELAGESHLSVGDILASSAVPRRVVLSGCETARTPEGERAVGDSLAHSFIAAGSDTVIAAVRPVEDVLAGAVARDLYAGAGDAEWELVTAFQAAQDAASRDLPGTDWAAYRVVVR